MRTVGKPEIRTKMHQIAMQHMKKETGENPVFSPVLWQGQKDLSRLPPRSGLDAAHRAAGPHDTHRRRACGRTSLPNPTAH